MASNRQDSREDRGAFDRIGWSGFGWTGIGWAQSFEAPRARLFKTRLLLLPLALLFAAGIWLGCRARAAA
jgi:hypothetical protein